MAPSECSFSIAGLPKVPPHLPDELKLMILAYVFDSPGLRRIRARTFWFLKRSRVDPILRWPDWAHLVPRALYSKNTVRVDMNYSAWTGLYELCYPPPSWAKFIHTLEVRINDVGFRDGRIPTVFLQFLRNLEAGDLGFDNIKLLRFTVKMRDSISSDDGRYRDVRDHLWGDPPFRFRAEKLEVQMGNHICGPQCTNNTFCYYISDIKKCISVYKEIQVDTEE